MSTMRLIVNKAQDAITNMAIDEAIMKHGKPTLRLYEWSPPAVSIGYFQSLTAEVDVEKCTENGIDVVRRITGGGAVFHEHELTYSFIMPENRVPANIVESYKTICGAVVNGLKLCGLDAQFIPINDILVEGKKISGSAQTRKEGMVLQHGTILMDVDVDKMFVHLKVPDEKMKDKIIQNVKDRVTSFRSFKKDTVHLKAHLIKAFEDQFNVCLLRGELTPKEIQTSSLLMEKFRSSEWTNKR